MDFEVAFAKRYRVLYESASPLQLQEDGSFGGEWVTLGEFAGNEGRQTTGTFKPVLTRSIRIDLIEGRMSGWGFSVWSLSVLGTSQHKPAYSYFVSAAANDLNTWWKFKIINDVESSTRKKAFKSVGKHGMPNKYIHEDPLSEREEALKQCEAVIVMYSHESASGDQDNHVIDDVRDAMQMNKPIIPIVVDGLTFKSEGVLLRWPASDPTLKAAFEQLIFVDFSNPDNYAHSLGLLIRSLKG